jgi:hypothetical protein
VLFRNMSDGHRYLKTNELLETVCAFEVFDEELGRVQFDPYRWKWAIIALHNSLQGIMVLSLRGSNSFHVLRQEDVKRWLAAYGKGEPLPGNLKLINFLDLYKRVKSKRMIRYIDSQKFKPEGSQGRSVKLLNLLRNKFIHFTPQTWLLDLTGLSTMVLDCIDIAEFLAWQSNNILWGDEGLRERMEMAIQSAKITLKKSEKPSVNTVP